jgi:hypothetical protein
VLAQNAATEYQVKATFLLNFARFVEWPVDAFQNKTTPITLCVFRYDPFGHALDDIIRKKLVNNREVVARRISDLRDVKWCQIIFVSSREDQHLSEITDSLKWRSALVVGEGEDFATRGGGIQFFVEGNQLRFAVNLDAVQRVRLRISSTMLMLATIVRDGGHPKGD